MKSTVLDDCLFKLFNYMDFSQHNNKLNDNYVYSL